MVINPIAFYLTSSEISECQIVGIAILGKCGVIIGKIRKIMALN